MHFSKDTLEFFSVSIRYNISINIKIQKEIIIESNFFLYDLEVKQKFV